MLAKTTLSLICAAGLALAAPTHAQDQAKVAGGGGGGGGSTPQPLAPPKPSDGSGLSFDFDGGSVQDFVGAIRDASKDRDRLSIIIDPGVERVMLGGVKIRGLTREDCFQLIPNIRVRASDPSPEVELHHDATGPGSLLVRITGSGDGATQEMPTLQVLPIGQVVAGLDPDAGRALLEDSIAATLKMLNASRPDNPAPPAQVSLHMESGTMMISGTTDQLRAIEHLLGLMRIERRLINEASQERNARDARLQYAVKIAQIDLDAARARREHVDTELNRAQAMREKGHTSDGEVERLSLERRLASLDEARAEARLNAAQAGWSPEPNIPTGPTGLPMQRLPDAGPATDSLRALAALKEAAAEAERAKAELADSRAMIEALRVRVVELEAKLDQAQKK